MMNVKGIIDQHPTWKRWLHQCLVHPVASRPRWWLRCLRPFYTQCSCRSILHRSARLDVVPFHRFQVGAFSVVEDFCCINNMMGDVKIGTHSRVGLHNTIIGPVTIGNEVNLAQGVVVTALNHEFSDATQTINAQGVNCQLVTIEDDVWVGANAVITQGVHIGTHAVVGAGSVVTHDVPPYSVVAGVPARIIKRIK